VSSLDVETSAFPDPQLLSFGRRLLDNARALGIG